MAQQPNDLRERLLAALPQPENIASYREETASLLAKHKKALFWERMASIVCYMTTGIMVALWFLGRAPTAAMRQYFWPLAGFAYFLGAIQDLRYRVYQCRVDTLKEVKQVQLQILELQASLRKEP